MTVIQELIAPYKEVFLSTTVREINRKGGSNVQISDFIIDLITEDTVVGEYRLVIDAYIPDVQRIRVYLYYDGVPGDSDLYYERYYENNTVGNGPMITQVVRETLGFIKKNIQDIRRIVRVSNLYAVVPDCALVDENGNPVIDHLGNYIVHTCEPPVNPVTITVKLWVDTDGNGIYVSTESATTPSNVTVELLNALTNTTISTGIGNGSSDILFNELPGAYKLRTTALAGHTATLIPALSNSPTINTLTSLYETGVFTIVPNTPQTFYLGFKPNPTLTGEYNGILAFNTTMLLFPSDTLQNIVRINLLPLGTYTVEEIPNTHGVAIRNAAIHATGKILSVSTDHKLWEFDPYTNVVIEYPIYEMRIMNVIIRLPSGIVIGYSSDPAIDNSIHYNLLSHDGTNYVTDVHSGTAGINLYIYEGTATTDGGVLLATSEGLLRHTDVNSFTFTFINNQPTYSVVPFTSNSGSQRYAVTCATEKSLTPMINLQIYNAVFALLTTISLPSTIHYASPPVSVASPGGYFLIYGHGTDGIRYLVDTVSGSVTPSTFTGVPGLFDVSRYMGAADGRTWGSTLVDNVLANASIVVGSYGGAHTLVRNKFAVNTIMNENPPGLPDLPMVDYVLSNPTSWPGIEPPPTMTVYRGLPNFTYLWETNSYSGFIATNGAMYALPANITSPVMKITFANGNMGATAPVTLSEGTAITSAARDATGTIISHKGNIVWTLNPFTDVVTTKPSTTTSQVASVAHVCGTDGNIRGVAVVSGQLHLFTIQRNTHVVTETTVTGFTGTIRDMIIHPNGLLYIAGSDGIWSMPQTGGSVTHVYISVNDYSLWTVHSPPLLPVQTTTASAIGTGASIRSYGELGGYESMGATLPITTNIYRRPVQSTNSLLYYGWSGSDYPVIEVASQWSGNTQTYPSGTFTVPNQVGAFMMGYDGNIYGAPLNDNGLTIIIEAGAATPDPLWVEGIYVNNFSEVGNNMNPSSN